MRQSTRLVVDTNCLQSEELHDFLTSSKTHHAVLPDCAFMEMHNSALEEALRSNLSVLSQFPNQVLVLKTTDVACGLSGRRAGLSKRLIDAKYTKLFSQFVEAVMRPDGGGDAYRKALLRKQHETRERLSLMAADLSQRAAGYRELEALFTAAEVKEMRLSKSISPSTSLKFFELVMGLAWHMHDAHPRTKREPTVEEWPYTFLYRFALFQHLHFLYWIRKGSPTRLSPDKIRNDVTDLVFGTYATYFDGFLTKDQRSMATYHQAMHMLENVIVPASRASYEQT